MTLIELMVAMCLSVVLSLGVINVVASNQKHYNQTYRRVFGDVVQEAEITKRIFERVVRKSSIHDFEIGTAGEYVRAFYYNHPGTSTHYDRYATFLLSGTDLVMEHGALQTGTFIPDTSTEVTQVLARNAGVPSGGVLFTQYGASVHLRVTLDDGRVRLPVVVTATRHNE